MADGKRETGWVVVVGLYLFSSLGLLVCALVHRLFFGAADKMPQFLFHLCLLFAVVYMLNQMVLVPVLFFYFGRRDRKGATPVKATVKDLVGLPFGAANPDAAVPRWISIPLLAVLWLLIGIVGFILVMWFVSFVLR